MFQNVLVMSMCRRRASADDAARAAPEDAPTPTYVKAVDCAQIPSDDDCKSTDTSGPEQVVDTSSDDSDTDGDETDLVPNSDSSSGESDSDLETSCAKSREFTVQHGRFTRRRHAARRRSRAAAPAPSAVELQQPLGHSGVQQEGKSIRAVINALNDWLESNESEDPCQSKQDPESPEGDAQRQLVDVLQDALSNIAPQDAAMMKALLDSKLAIQAH